MFRRRESNLILSTNLNNSSNCLKENSLVPRNYLRVVS
ncbi:hypothetical protein LEP1GSC052_1140 [Leptospira kmetyi serovar Malaysia str. Bejo-Iso9]|nr:hypothetical protein LEP1GSC052_0590 [Leptospira kmetyi serovar Malaysia str. Bejo-Iso9]EQA52901.1 hypothetical protein LEP1GSC052_1140 [Leptospira kmetyi serovar Malaysia str. Bejo-Iso9]